MRYLRIRYAITIILIIIAGLLSRHFSFIPLWIGDFLYAVMAFFMVRFLFPFSKTGTIILLSLAFCYCIEFSQLYQAAWINNIRRTVPGRLILGQGFLWSDILAYTIAIFFSAMADSYFRKKIR
ncbi:MAG: DUF2809 domain-containing protein [Ferruginibacter sp.]